MSSNEKQPLLVTSYQNLFLYSKKLETKNHNLKTQVRELTKACAARKVAIEKAREQLKIAEEKLQKIESPVNNSELSNKQVGFEIEETYSKGFGLSYICFLLLISAVLLSPHFEQEFAIVAGKIVLGIVSICFVFDVVLKIANFWINLKFMKEWKIDKDLN